MTKNRLELVISSAVTSYQSAILLDGETGTRLSCWSVTSDNGALLKSEEGTPTSRVQLHLFTSLAGSSWDRCSLATSVAHDDVNVGNNVSIDGISAAVATCKLPNSPLEPSQGQCENSRFRVPVVVAIRLTPEIRDVALFLGGPVAVAVSRVLQSVPSCTDLVSMNVSHAIVHFSFISAMQVNSTNQTCAVTVDDLAALQGLIVVVGRHVVQASRVWQVGCTSPNSDTGPTAAPPPPTVSFGTPDNAEMTATRTAAIVVGSIVIILLAVALLIFALFWRRSPASQHLSKKPPTRAPMAAELEIDDADVIYGRLDSAMTSFDMEGMIDDEVDQFYTSAARGPGGTLVVEGVDVDGAIYCLADSASMSTMSNTAPMTNAFDRLERLREESSEHRLPKSQPPIVTLWSAPADSDAALLSACFDGHDQTDTPPPESSRRGVREMVRHMESGVASRQTSAAGSIFASSTVTSDGDPHTTEYGFITAGRWAE
jgi:hypothetical protein